jgi:hypothetical protein
VPRTLPCGVATIETRKPLCKRVFLKHKEGNRIAVEVRVSAVMDERGRTVGAVEIFRDAGSDHGVDSGGEQTCDPLRGRSCGRPIGQELNAAVNMLDRASPFP